MSFIKKNLLGGYDKKSAEQYIKMIKQNADKAESDYLKQIADLKAEIISLKSDKKALQNKLDYYEKSSLNKSVNIVKVHLKSGSGEQK